MFERTFRDFGLPAATRTDNGTPLAVSWAMFGLSSLAVWWLHPGIRLQRIKPGQPQQNGRHELRRQSFVVTQLRCQGAATQLAHAGVME